MMTMKSTVSKKGRVIPSLLLAVFLSASLSAALPLPLRDQKLQAIASEIGLLINFSVPCDLNAAIAIPDRGGLLTPVLLGIGYQEYKYDGSKWGLINQQGNLFNKSLVQVGSFQGTSESITFGLLPRLHYSYTTEATVTATPVVSVRQAFAIPLQLLKTTAAVNESTYSDSDYVQRFGTQAGLSPDANYTAQAKAGDTFLSRFSAFYAFYLPINTSPQLATRVPRCGDERFYGLQYGRNFP